MRVCSWIRGASYLQAQAQVRIKVQVQVRDKRQYKYKMRDNAGIYEHLYVKSSRDGCIYLTVKWQE